MTWAVDDDVSPFTYWLCSECKEVVAWEDESKERDCNACGMAKGQLFLWDRVSVFWYCVACQVKVPDDGPKPEWVDI